MAKKSSLRLTYDFPVTVTFVLAALLVFVLDSFVFKGKLMSSAFVCHGAKTAEIPFNFKSPGNIAGLILYVLGNRDWNMLFSNLILILFLGQILEERYGSLMLGIMTFISTLVGGVLTACISTVPLTGAGSLVFMMLVLVSLTELTKKRIPVYCLTAFILYLAFSFYRNSEGIKGADFLQKNVGVLVELIGGITGSIFGFLVSPKKRSAPKKSEKAEKTVQFSYDDEDTGKKKSYSSSDETIIGSIDL